ncbi:Rho-type GTPase-activating protein [Saccharomyces pastorianus]|uniref:Rho-type GTPase-activating protein n=1 Tax=Saccharomyces pastorianus TaxID=27292 RepID=A0A6C1E981_SACPS|nr:Rho-type GTPase-activating protein [Saccharomyces pastorianus]
MASTLPNEQFPSCVRCKDSITTGHAYELGCDRWHTHCFSCYKCEKPLSCESDFLVLGTGALICFDCSDSCKNCGKKIDDLAIILSSSNEAYCSDCFKCCKCGDNIADLRYAKTKRGLFCLNCHEKLLAKRKYYEEKKRRLKKNLPSLPTPVLDNDSIDVTSITAVAPKRSSSRPVSPVKKISLESESMKDIAIETNSSDIIPHFITGYDDSDDNSGSSKFGSNISIDIIEPQQDSAEHAKDEKVEEVKVHSRNASLDIALDATPSHKVLLGNTEPPSRSKILLNKTPLRNSSGQYVAKSPSSYRQGIVVNDSFEENNQVEPPNDGSRTASELLSSVLHSPVSVNMKDSEGLDLDLFNARSVSHMAPSLSMNGLNNIRGEKSQSQTVGVKGDRNSNDLISTQQQQAAKSSSHSNDNGNNKKISRSLSRRSKDLMYNLKSKATSKQDNSIKLSPASKPSSRGSQELLREFDTHPSLGTTSTNSNYIDTLVKNQKNLNPKGSADSSIPKTNSDIGHSADELNYLGIKSPSPIGHLLQSPATPSNVSMYRTPPLESSLTFDRMNGSSYSNHNHSLPSWQNTPKTQLEKKGNLEGQSNESKDRSSFDKEITAAELHLKKLNINLKELESQREQLMKEINEMKSTKETLRQHIEAFNIERSKLYLDSSDSSENPPTIKETGLDGLSPMRHVATTSSVTRSSVKPKFWKFFSSTKPQAEQSIQGTNTSNLNSVIKAAPVLHSVPLATSSSGRIEISPPVLQNPNEFSDVKLVPIENSGSMALNKDTEDYSDGSNLYGSTLVARCNYEKNKIPMLLSVCIDFIEANEENMKSEGIYRKSGSQLVIEEIERQFSLWQVQHDNEIPNILTDQDLNAVTGVLKRYLRKLPNPIFTFQVYEPLMNLVKSRKMMETLPFTGGKLSLDSRNSDNYTTSVSALKSILERLPKEHHRVLRVLSEHIEKVTKYSDWNRMTLNNLALVFAPGLIRDFSGEKDIIDMKERNYIVAFILVNYRELLA